MKADIDGMGSYRREEAPRIQSGTGLVKTEWFRYDAPYPVAAGDVTQAR